MLESDGGTRTASITGGFVALVCAVDKLLKQGKLKESPSCIKSPPSARASWNVALPGIFAILEDSAAQTDMNFVMGRNRDFVGIAGHRRGPGLLPGRAERDSGPGRKGIDELHEKQREALGEMARHIAPKRTIVIASNNAHKIQEISPCWRIGST